MTRHDVLELEAKNAELSARLQEAEETIHAIQRGAVDAFVLEELGRHRVYMLEGADRPFRMFVDNVPQGVATLAHDGTIAYANSKMSDLLGTPHEKIVGRPFRSFVSDDDLTAYEAIFHAGQTGSGRGELRLRAADGETVPAYASFHALPGDSSGLVGVFVTDLTSQKRNERLVAADRRKNEFLAMLSHELRNPLAPIRNAVHILRLSGEDTAAVQSTCGLLERQVGQMVRLVDDLLDVSRITRDKLELRLERLELGTVLDQAVETVRPLCAEMGHDLAFERPGERIYVDGDPARMTQIFSNLLDNACKYMDPGGRITIKVATERRSDRNEEAAISIRDGGVGIPPDQLSRIFDMFAQVDTSLERAKSGLGIGLTLAARLVAMHGGRIEARSEGPGRGSEFVVYLPTAHAPKDAGKKKQGTEQPTRTYDILVVDDHHDSAETLAHLLRLMGHRTHTAEDGEEAIAAAEKFRPEVILLDLGMPKLNGYEACRRIKAEPWSKGMILIAQTGWGQDEDRRSTEEAGFDGHLVKPVEPDALLKMLASLSERR